LTRRVLLGRRFRDGLRDVTEWLATERPVSEIERLRIEIDHLEGRLRAFPRLGREMAVHQGSSLRVVRLGRLPYLVWYSCKPDDPDAPVWLLLLMHEKQDREPFAPGRSD
jgi:plasmid stabilization system protein ParE